WYRDWFSGNSVYALPRYDFDGHKNVLQTNPPGRDSELLFGRKLAVPADRPHLYFSARCDDKSTCKVLVEIEGRQQVLEDLNGAAWRTFDLDLSAFKGKEASVQIRQITGATSTP